MRRCAIILVAVLALVACDPVAEQSPPAPASESAPASDDATPAPSDTAVPTEPAPTDSAEPSPPAPSTPADDRTTTGTLSGDAQLEGGCVWIDTREGAIEPLLPEGYSTTANPVALVGPDGEVVAEAGDQVTIFGRPAPEILTTCQVGAVWHVTAIEVDEG